MHWWSREVGSLVPAPKIVNFVRFLRAKSSKIVICAPLPAVPCTYTGALTTLDAANIKPPYTSDNNIKQQDNINTFKSKSKISIRNLQRIKASKMTWFSRMCKTASQLSHSNIALATNRTFISQSGESIFPKAPILSYFSYIGNISISTHLNGIPVTSNPNKETRRWMSKYLSKAATKRLPLNTKRAKKGYYKGKGCTSEGRLTSKGKFIADPLKKLQLIVPDLTGFPLKPYIAKSISRHPPEDRINFQA